MDRIVIKTDRLRRLSRIADMSTVHLMQSDLYITLAHAVEEYMIQPTVDNHSQMERVLATCKRHFSDYDNLRTQLVGELEINGNLSISSSKVPSTPTKSGVIENDDHDVAEKPMISQTDNITYVDFSKKR